MPSKGATPKRKPFMQVGMPGRKVAGVGTPLLPRVAGSNGDATIPLGPAPPGRPISNIGDYLLKPTDATTTGYEMLNDQPDLIDKVNEQYLKSFQLPPALQPKYLRKPEALDHQRATKISKGWRAPRSRSR